MHTMLIYNGTGPNPAVANFDLTAAADPSFSRRNGHYIFTEKYRMLYLSAFAAHLSDAAVRSPLINAISTDGIRIGGFNVAAGISGAPTLADRWVGMRIDVPQMEEVQMVTTTATASEIQWGAMVLGTDGWNANLPAGIPTVLEATTTAFTPTVNTWSADQGLTFNSNPRGGVYAVIAARCQFAADLLAFRLNFPRTKLYNGRKLFPGWFAQNAVGSFEDVVTQSNPFHLGVWGYFHTFEPPLLQVYASTAAALTPIVRLWCVYMGQDVSLLDSAYASMP